VRGLADQQCRPPLREQTGTQRRERVRHLPHRVREPEQPTALVRAHPLREGDLGGDPGPASRRRDPGRFTFLERLRLQVHRDLGLGRDRGRLDPLQLAEQIDAFRVADRTTGRDPKTLHENTQLNHGHRHGRCRGSRSASICHVPDATGDHRQDCRPGVLPCNL